MHIMTAAYKSLISPRSRTPIVFPADDEEDVDENETIGIGRQSLALPSPTTTLPYSMTAPSSILKSRVMGDRDRDLGDRDTDLLGRSALPYSMQSKMEEEASAYRRRLETYRQAQHQQALLVARLQSKLLQYRQRCSELESKLGQAPGQELLYGSPTGTEHRTRDPGNDLDDALWKLEQEKIRNENLLQLNGNLRGELDETRHVNDALSTDLQKLSDDWERLTKQMLEREQLWKAEEQAYTDYYASEHSKLLDLWRRVSATKREFADMKSSTGRDMAQLKNTIARMSNDISSSVLTAAVSAPTPQQEAHQASFIAQLTQEVQNANNTQDNLRQQLRERNDKISELDSVIAETQNKMQNLQHEMSRIETQELGRLGNCLQEIAKLLLNDFDQYGVEEGHDLHLTSTPAIFVFDENGDNNNPIVFAESVVSAVQAALNKRQLEIHQLQVNLSSQKEQSILVRGHVESLESDLGKAEEKISIFSEDNERMKNEIENFKMDKDATQRSLESLKTEKNLLEQQRKALANELDSTARAKNNLSSNLSKLEKSADAYRDEVETLRNELEKVRDELSSVATQLKSEQDINNRIREQLSFVGQDKERSASENKSLKTQQNELVTKYEDLVFQFERSEDALKKWKMDNEILADKLKSTSEQATNAEKEKKKALEKARQVEDAKALLEARIAEYESDLNSLRREALDAERNRMEQEGRIEKLVEQLDTTDTKKGMLETQLDALDSQYSKEMSLMSERVELLTEELNQSRRDYDQLMQNLERTKAELVNVDKMHMEAIHIVENKELALKNVTSALEKLRDEKLSFEELEDALKKALLEKDRKIDMLDKQMMETKSKLSQELAILKDKLASTQQDSKVLIEKAESEKVSLEMKYKKEFDNMKLVYDAKEEKLKAFFTEKLKVQQTELQGEKKSEAIKLSSEISALKQQIDSSRIQYEESMLRAENKFQQGLLLAQQDQQGLMERIRLLEKELDDSRSEKDRLRRDYETKFGHEKSIASSLRSELMKLRNELDTNKQDYFDTQKQIETRIAEIDHEREASLMQIEELKNKLRSAEEREAELTRELNDVLRKLKEMEASGDNCRRELVETRHSLTELSLEKEKSMTAIEQLKEDVNRRDNENRNLKKELSKAQNNVKKLETVKIAQEEEMASLTMRLDAAAKEIAESTKSIEEYNEQLLNCKSQINRADSEIADLRLRLEAETERREDAESRFRNAKKMFEDAEARLNSSKSEEERLSMKLAEVEERYGNREGQLLQLADEHKQREKKLLEEKHNLNVCLVSVQQQMEQLGSKLAKAEDRLRYLTDEKTGLEARRKDAEAKLMQFQSGMKRLGLTQVSIDNPEAVRRLMATLHAQMTSIQQDRDTMAAQLSAAKDNISALETGKIQLEDHVSQLNRNLQNAQSIQKGKESALFQLERDLELKNNELGRLVDKLAELDEGLKAREELIRNTKAEKESQREEYERAKQRWEESRSQNDSKWTKAEVQIRSLEGDLHRMSMVLQQKELHIQSLEDKCTTGQRSMNELEQRCSSLTMTVEQLNITNEKALQEEREWKEKYHVLSRNLNENASNLSVLGEKVRSLQREKAMLEQERNNLNERWEMSASALADFKRQVQVLSDKNQKLRQQTEEMTRNAIDKQLKISIAESGKEDLRMVLGDKLELQRKIDTLMERIRDLERENRELERMKDLPQIKSGRQTPYIRDNAMVVLEEENAELRRKVSKLEGEIRDLERRHAKHIGEVTIQVKQERDLELERARAAKLQAERLLEARESNYRQQVHRLEQQNTHLKEQLSEEVKRRQSFLSRSFRTGQEIRSLRQALGDSLRTVAMDPNTMESETRRLDSTLDLHHRTASQASMLSPMRDLASPGLGLRGTSPIPK